MLWRDLFAKSRTDQATISERRTAYSTIATRRSNASCRAIGRVSRRQKQAARELKRSCRRSIRSCRRSRTRTSPPISGCRSAATATISAMSLRGDSWRFFRRKSASRSPKAAAGWNWRKRSPIPKNPLTARVIVNRDLAASFGQGIVAHAEQLRTNWRAADPSGTARLPGVVLHGKRLVDEEAASRDHALGDVPVERRPHSERATAKDPENTLPVACEPAAARMRKSLRDSLLFVSGKLDPTPGEQAAAARRKESASARSTASSAAGELDGLLSLFDFPNPNSTSEAACDQRSAAAAVLHEQLFMDEAARRWRSELDGTPEAEDPACTATLFGRDAGCGRAAARA